MTNFDLFTKEQDFLTFADIAVAAERTYQIDPATCAINCPRCMQTAVKWMYSVDKHLAMPYQDTLVSLMGAEDFRDAGGFDLWQRMDYIRRPGNTAAHGGKKVSKAQAGLCLEDLFIFLDFVSYCYGKNYQEREFDRSLLEEERIAAAPAEPRNDSDGTKEVDLAALMAENAALREELTARRETQ